MSCIIIACTPRTGSNLLMLSLSQHHQAVCGGEWHSEDQYRCDPGHWENKKTNPDKVNLIKVFWPEPIPFDGMVVHLYREDIESQIASWERASETGEWISGKSSEPTEMPANARSIIAGSSYQADVHISYEWMVSHWEETIAMLLEMAGWEVIPLGMAIEKQGGTPK